MPVSVLRSTGAGSREHAGHRREVADITVHYAEQRADGFLVRRDAVEIAALSKPPRDRPPLISATIQVFQLAHVVTLHLKALT